MNTYKMKTSLITSTIFLFCAAIILSAFSYNKNSNGLLSVSDYTDTISFQPNISGGWGSYSTYLQNNTDSVRFEVILFRNMSSGNNWSNTIGVGKIIGNYRPLSKRTIIYGEWPRTWKITIENDGQCNIKLLNGNPPTGSTVIIPIKTKYKK